ncbi:hypothetical protein [Streptomyces violaceorubidus]|uniref:hypothetical protein n=1 Tax=Streptomyces violaceorubidus TaxID=284042 RepID=UPI0004BF35FE|nr:hypothetical protein [Streptomyces violaceorubidus]
MTAQAVYRLLCDAPHCLASELVEDLRQVPDGWRKLKSTDHIAVPPRQLAFERRRPRTLTYSEQCRGEFTLHLCPEHPNVFDAHLPRTDGIYTRPGRDSQAYASCSCGMKYVLCRTGWRIAGGDGRGPASHTENAWWRHLPAELQWYATRDAGQVER